MNVFITVIYQSTFRILQAVELCLLLSLPAGLLFVLEGNKSIILPKWHLAQAFELNQTAP